MRRGLVSGDFIWDEFFWKTTVDLADWREFEVRHVPFGAFRVPPATNGVVELVFAPEGRGDHALSSTEIGLVQWLLDHQRVVFDAAIQGLANAYPALRLQHEDAVVAGCMLALSSLADLRDLVALRAISVHNLNVRNLPYVGLELDCTWDGEHGVGVLMHGERIVEIGTGDTPYICG